MPFEIYSKLIPRSVPHFFNVINSILFSHTYIFYRISNAFLILTSYSAMILYIFLPVTLALIMFPIIFCLRKRWQEKVGRFHLVSSESPPVAAKFVEVLFQEENRATVRLKQCEYTGPHDVVVVGGNNVGTTRLLDSAITLEWDDNDITREVLVDENASRDWSFGSALADNCSLSNSTNTICLPTSPCFVHYSTIRSPFDTTESKLNHTDREFLL